MTSILDRQSDDVIPPRRSQIIALAVDTTGRAYDMTAVAWGGKTYDPNQPDDPIFLTLAAETADVYFAFSDSNSSPTTLSTTAKVTAGQPLAFDATYAARIPTNGFVDVRIRRGVDKYLIVRGSSSATLRIWATSVPMNYSGGT